MEDNMSHLKDLTGQKFNRWTVVSRAQNDKRGQAQWHCVCECGNTSIVGGKDLRLGKSRSCGCLQKDTMSVLSKKHGHSHERLYRIWSVMRQRCKNKDVPEYKRYGQRGISVCAEWDNSFESFYIWAINNGYDNSLSIDRIDVNGNYEPSNCRWADNRTQARNKRNPHLIEFRGEKKMLIEWTETLGLNYRRIKSRLQKGNWTVEEAFTTPKMKSKNDRIRYKMGVAV